MSSNTELVASQETVVSSVLTPMEVLNNAIAKGVDADQLEKLLTLSERYDANEAKKAFDAAMTEFRAKAITVIRNKHVNFKNKKGGITDYRHVSLDAAVEAAAPHMAQHGLSHRWEVDQETTDHGERITVYCFVTHAKGHSERTKLSAYDDDSGAKNKIQAIGSAVSYLERYTFLAATGLAAKDQDDDGRSSGRIVDQQSIEYMDLVREHWDTIHFIKDQCFKADKCDTEEDAEEVLLQALEAWRELGEDAMKVLWRAPSKGGVFSTREREQLKLSGSIAERRRIAARGAE